MDNSRYPKEIQSLISEIVEMRYYDQDEAMKKCRNLVQIGKKDNDAYLLGMAYFYLAEGYYVENEHQKSIQYLLKSMGFQQQTQQWNLFARSYNLLGLIAEMEGNVAGALDYYLTALECSKTYHLLYEECLIYTTIGDLYEKQREYKTALSYYRKFFKDMDVIRQDLFGMQNLINIRLLEGRCCLHLNDLEGAELCREKIKAYEEHAYRSNSSMLGLLCFYARYAHMTGDERSRDESIEMFLQRIEKGIMVECYDHIYDLFELLFEIKNYKVIGEMIPLLNSCLEPVKMAHIRRQFKRLEAKYYKHTGNKDRFFECCSELYELEELQEKEVLAGNRRTIELRFDIEKMKEHSDIEE